MNESSYPYRFERTHEVSALRERFADLGPGDETGTAARIAGRVMTLRTHGKIAFADLQDGSGTMQLFAQHAVLGDDGMERFLRLSVGDIAGAEGEMVMTRRGELSLKVSDVTLLAECRRPMPDNWHGLSDVEARYRQRYLDLVLNDDARRVVSARAVVNRTIRSFFDDRGFLEVETPLLQPLAGGAVARPFVTHHNALDMDLYLRVAPELYLKRLLVGGLERVYELNRSFRNEGVSTRHNPEFTMLEAYEAFVDYHDTMTLVEDLVREIARALVPSLQVQIGQETVDLTEAFPRLSMFEVIARATGRDLTADWDRRESTDWGAIARDLDVRVDAAWGPGKVLAEIFEATTEKTLIAPTFVTGFPKEVSPLAKDHRSIAGFTEQADLILGGLEIAPIYSELNDPDEQRRRFEQQAAARAAGDEEAAVRDEDFLEALEFAMPPAGGFGLGIDRLLMLLLNETSIREVVLFPTMRPQQRD